MSSAAVVIGALRAMTLVQAEETECELFIRLAILINTVNPLYNDIRYNSKSCYNGILVCTKISESCIFFIDSPILFFRKTCVFDICKNTYILLAITVFIRLLDEFFVLLE